MITDTEIKSKGVEILATHLGDVEMERFIALIQREPFDYTKWHKKINDDTSLEELSRKAMSLRSKKN
jgi:predicted LPLAT superfamily acyltransferase